jgi:hypothetical protein
MAACFQHPHSTCRAGAPRRTRQGPVAGGDGFQLVDGCVPIDAAGVVDLRVGAACI